MGAVAVVPELTNLRTPGQRIRFLRREVMKITQEELAKRCHSSQSAVAHWEGDDYLPSRQSQHLLAEALSASRSFLFGEAAA